jgi:hypothetical protein
MKLVPVLRPTTLLLPAAKRPGWRRWHAGMADMESWCIFLHGYGGFGILLILNNSRGKTVLGTYSGSLVGCNVRGGRTTKAETRIPPIHQG